MSDDLDYLQEGSEAQKAELMAKSEESLEADIFHFDRIEGANKWLLIGAYRNTGQGVISMTHGMDLRGGVLVRVTETRGGTGVSVHTTFLKYYSLRENADNKEVYDLVYEE